MLTYTIEHNDGLKTFVRKTLHVEGKADFRQRERLKMIFYDALSSSDHLIVNIEKVEECNYSFSALIFSIRRTAKLLGKRLTIKGKATGYFLCMHESGQHLRKKERLFNVTNPCYLWERPSRSSPEFPGTLQRPLAHKKSGRDR